MPHSTAAVPHHCRGAGCSPSTSRAATLATHIAGELALRGQHVILLDADPQGSSLDWTQRRSQQGLPRLFSAVGLARETLHQEAPELARRCDHIVIDGPPRIAALARARLLTRVGVIVRHRALGWRENAMVVWQLPDAAIPAAGVALSAIPGVTLCYQRRAVPGVWDWPLFCMIHARTRAEAMAVLDQARCIAGYHLYMDLVPPELLEGKQRISTGMRHETERCEAAVDAALAGQATALVCSGDPGIYALAGLALEVLESRNLVGVVPFGVVPGVPAVCAAAALLGAPLTHDFACISLSDLLTPWETIVKRLTAALEADFVCVIYNPRSKGRPGHLDAHV